MKPIRLFYSYSHKDEDLRNRLEIHLTALKRQQIIDDWHDRRIGLGSEWKNELDNNLKTADIILLLVSPDFIASDYCYDTELTYALQQHEVGAAVVIPVILECCHAEGLPFMKLQGAPKDMIPVTSWTNQNEAFADIVKKIRSIAEYILKNKATLHKKDVEILIDDSRGIARTFSTVKAGERGSFAVYEKTFYIKGTSLVMVYVPAGEFMMGSNGSKVKIKQPFYMGKFPVTQAQYEAVMGDNPSSFKWNTNLPVENMTWSQIKEFCEGLFQQTGIDFRLPSEAEWEYACRAGTTTRYWWGNDMEDFRCWHGGNSGKQTHLVYEKKEVHTNPFGLCDMHGHIWEWCEDNWAEDYTTPRTQKAFQNQSNQRVARGGSWSHWPLHVSSTSRVQLNTSERGDNIGFRLVFFP